MPRILFICARHPAPPMRGDQLRAYHLAVALGRSADVTLACFGSGDEPPVPGVEVRTVARLPAPTVIANALAPDPRLPLQVRMFLDRGMTRLVREQMARVRPDVVHVTLGRMGPYATAPDPRAHVHLDFVDSLSLNLSSRAAASPSPLRPPLRLESWLMRGYESRLARAVDSCSVVAERDRAVGGLERAVVIPNGVDTDGFPFSDPSERPPRLIFFGNLGYFHNIAPARTAALSILPLVRRRDDAATLRIAGARPAAAVREVADAAGVELRADVQDMGAELRAAAVAVLPMASGSGMKNKVIEAFSSGTPVVTTRAGIEGVDGAVDGVHYVQAETTEELADACLSLIADPARRSALARAARELVVDRYSWDRRAETLLDLYAGRVS